MQIFFPYQGGFNVDEFMMIPIKKSTNANFICWNFGVNLSGCNSRLRFQIYVTLRRRLLALFRSDKIT